jgi:hypothetical protein
MTHGLMVLIALVNAAVCCAIGVASLCRIAKLREGTRKSFRVVYALLFGASVLSALQSITPPFYTWPSPADVAINVAILVWLVSGRRAWAAGAPEYTTAPAPLDEAAR